MDLDSSWSEEFISYTEEEELRKEALPLRDRLFLTFDIPTFGKLATAYAFINFSTIFISTATFLISTLPSFHYGSSSLFVVEATVLSFFTFDYIGRLILTRQHRIKFVLQFMNLIDLFAILPFYVETALMYTEAISGLIVLRILRLLRVFRILKLFKYSKQLPVAVRSIKASGAGFGVAIFSISLFVILWASAMFYAELSGCQLDPVDLVWKYDDGTLTPFQSIPHTLWWTIVTMTTVGYGDDVPRTAAGKVVGSGAMVCGVLVLAFPLTILAGNFASEYGAYLVEEEIKDKKKLTKEEKRKPKPEPPKKILKSVWNELLTLRKGLDSSKSVILAFDRQLMKIDLYVQRLERAMAKQSVSRSRDRGKAKIFK